MMSVQDALKDRMTDLEWTQYRLVQEICKLRAEDGEVPPVSKYQSSIKQALDRPENVKFYIIKDIVNALGGELVIHWRNIEEVKI